VLFESLLHKKSLFEKEQKAMKLLPVITELQALLDGTCEYKRRTDAAQGGWEIRLDESLLKTPLTKKGTRASAWLVARCLDGRNCGSTGGIVSGRENQVEEMVRTVVGMIAHVMAGEGGVGLGGPFLVVAKVVEELEKWKKAVEEMLPGCGVVVYAGTIAEKRKIWEGGGVDIDVARATGTEFPIVLTTLETARCDVRISGLGEIGYVICDEGGGERALKKTSRRASHYETNEHNIAYFARRRKRRRRRHEAEAEQTGNCEQN